MFRKLSLIGIAALALAMETLTIQAQTPSIPNLPPIQGTIWQYQGQSFLITTNANGNLIVQTFGVQGTNTVIVPVNEAQAAQTAEAWIEHNNPANLSYYGTNGEIEGRIGAGYLQNSGQAVASLSVIKWGLIKSQQNIGVEAGVLQGNKEGKQGTAGIYGGALYRKPIGDVAFEAGLDAGYDDWNYSWFIAPGAGLTYRQGPHLGEWLKVEYAFEKKGNIDTGLGIFGGVSYIF